MKKFIPIFTLIVLFLIGCSFQLPKSVSVKTKADYNFTIAKVEKKLSGYFNADKLREKFNDSETNDGKTEVYDYWPNMDGEMQQYLLRIPVQSVPIDLDSYFSDMEVSNEVKNMSFKQEIKVPDIQDVYVSKTVGILGSTIVSSLPETTYTVDGINFPITSSDSDFEECIIGKGQLILELVTEGWIGTNVSWESVTLPGGVTLDNSKFEKVELEGNKYQLKDSSSLNGVKIEKTGISVGITMKLSADSADLSKPPVLNVKCTVSEISSIKSKLPEGTQTKVEKEEPFEIDDAVDKIMLGKSEFICTYYNTMPAGNAYTLTCSSAFLGIDPGVTKSLSNEIGKSTPENFKIDSNDAKLTFTTDSGEKGKLVERDASGDFPKIDFNATFDFGGTDGYVIANNVEPGETYELGVDVEINIVWISATIDKTKISKNESTSSEGKIINTGFDLSTVFNGVEDALGKGDDAEEFFSALSIKSVPIYIYCQTPDLEAFKNSEFEGNITLGKVVVNDDDTETFVAEQENGEDKNFFKDDKIVKANLPKLEKQGDVVVSNIDKQFCSGKSNLVGFAKSEKSGALALKVSDIVLSGGSSGDEIEITKAELDALKANSADENASYNIEIQAYVVLPLEFNIGLPSDPKEKIYYYTLPNFGGDEDLFGRSEALEDDKITKYLSVIKSARIGFNSPELSIRCTPINPAVYIRFGIPDSDEKKIILSADEYFSVSGQEVSDMLSTYPLQSTIRMGFAKGSFILNRGLKFGTTINLGLTTDGTIPLSDLKGGE